MTNLLIRDVPEDVLAAIDARAQAAWAVPQRLPSADPGPKANVSDVLVTIEALQRFADRFGDLADPEVMRRAWE
ncbi:hypothetical protein BH23ACT7_BH23ACT7_16450 [soil metagenome]